MSAAKKTTKKTTSKGAKASRKKAVKKTSARKKTGTKKTAARSAKKTASKKTAAKKTASKKTAARKKTVKKSTAKKTAAKKTSAKKTAAKKTTAKKSPARTKSSTSGRSSGPIMTRPAAPKRRVRPAKLDKKTLASIREKLQGDAAELEAQLEEIEANSMAESEDTGLHEDFADAGTSTFERERDLSIRNNVMDLLDQVKRAIARIDEGGYGTCESCGNPIDAARIKAFPRVLMCLDCKRRDERTR